MSKRFFYYGLSPVGGIVTDGLVLHLGDGNETSYPAPYTGTDWFDLTTPQYNGTLVNGVGYDSANGGSLTFDGTDDYIDLGSTDFTLIKDFTFEIFIEIDNLAPSIQRIFSKGFSGDYGFFIGRTGTGKITAQLKAGGTATSLSTVPNGQYVSISVTRSGNSLSIYLNGINDITSSISNLNLLTGGDSWLLSNQGGNFLKAKIPILRIYNRALIASEILQNYNARKSRYGL